MGCQRTFGAALEAALSGQRIARDGWNGKGQYVALQLPDANSFMSAPYLYLKNTAGEIVPWVPSQGDMFAEDWYSLEQIDA